MTHCKWPLLAVGLPSFALLLPAADPSSLTPGVQCQQERLLSHTCPVLASAVASNIQCNAAASTSPQDASRVCRLRREAAGGREIGLVLRKGPKAGPWAL